MFSRRSESSSKSTVAKAKKFLNMGTKTVLPASPPPSPPTTPGTSSEKPLPAIVPASAWGGAPVEWEAYNAAYASGKFDFNNPPKPPTDLAKAPMSKAAGGIYRAPKPLNEGKRQRAVNSLNMLRHKTASQPRPAAAASTTSVATVDSADSAATERAGPISAFDPTETVNLGDGEGGDEDDGDGDRRPSVKSLPTHDALQALALKATQTFGTGVSTVSLLDNDKQVFLAEVGQDAHVATREGVICSHTMLKASTGQTDPFVVLDFAEDWRFQENGFGEFSNGFYAAVPIMVPAPFGDTDQLAYPAGVFCILDNKPRKSFSDEDKAKLEKIADEAGQEIARFQEIEREKQKTNLVGKRDEWKRRAKVVKKVAVASPLDSVVEVPTPPATPIFDEVIEIPVVLPDGRRPSLARTMTSESASSTIVTTEVTPTFSRRRLVGQVGVHASTGPRMPSEIKSMIDLSTSLIGESLDLDFTYLLAVDIPSCTNSPDVDDEDGHRVKSKKLKLLSDHNVPIPAPLFDVKMHMETLVSAHNALLYSNPDPSAIEGEYSTGILVKVLVADQTGYVLGGFSENPSRVLNRQDFLFFRSFAADLARHCAQL